MKNLIDALVVATYISVMAWGGKYTLSYMDHKIKIMALEKAAVGLSDLTPMTQRMTGKNYSWQ
jgi:hypothetical protein